jgi:hypothetical protein
MQCEVALPITHPHARQQRRIHPKFNELSFHNAAAAAWFFGLIKAVLLQH